MAQKRFSTGDRVRHIIGGPVMEVRYYQSDKIPFLSLFQREPKVVCAWRDGGRYRKAIFEQNALIKLATQGPNPHHRIEVVPGVECREVN